MMSVKEKIALAVFNTALKNTNTRKLARRFWPVVRVEIEGHTFDLHPVDNTTELRLYRQREFDEPKSLKLMQDLVRDKNALIFDIGANCGMYTIPLAKSMGEGSFIHAFEPSPVMVKRVKANVELNNIQSNVKVHQVALASSSGKALLNVHPRNHGQSSLENLKKTLHTVEVEQRPITEFLKEKQQYDIFVIKIDVEGREDDVLYSFLQESERPDLPDALLLEVEHAAQWAKNLQELLIAKGYVVDFEDEGNALYTLAPNLS